MQYKIVSADPFIGQIKVNYYHNNQFVCQYQIDVPIVEGKFVTGEALEKEIQDRAPTGLVARLEQVNAASNFANLESLVQTQTLELLPVSETPQPT